MLLLYPQSLQEDRVASQQQKLTRRWEVQEQGTGMAAFWGEPGSWGSGCTLRAGRAEGALEDFHDRQPRS